jgi:hypothetical protein
MRQNVPTTTTSKKMYNAVVAEICVCTLSSFRERVIWAAGLFEGEGSFGSHEQTGYPRASLGMTDEDRVRLFHKVVGVGRIYEADRRSRGWKMYYRWQTGRFEHVQAVVAMLYPFLGPRRRDQARGMLERASDLYDARRHKVCKHGHPATVANTYVNRSTGARACRVCMRAAYVRYRDRIRSGAQPAPPSWRDAPRGK